jgi:hypothetical protein
VLVRADTLAGGPVYGYPQQDQLAGCFLFNAGPTAVALSPPGLAIVGPGQLCGVVGGITNLPQIYLTAQALYLLQGACQAYSWASSITRQGPYACTVRASSERHLAGRPTTARMKETAAMLSWAAPASGQIAMRKVDGWQSLGQAPAGGMIDLAT